MKKINLFFYGSLISIGILICWASLIMGYGELRNPGTGFLSFWCGFIITMISSVILIDQLLGKNIISLEKVRGGPKIDPLKPLIILGTMILFSLLLEKLGFVVCNFIFLVLVFRLVWKKKWGFILKTSLLIDLASYLILQTLMKVQLPQGFLSGILVW